MAIPADVELIPALRETAWGVQANWIFQRDFTKVSGEGKSSQYFLKTCLALTERLFLDAKVGMGDVHFNRDDGLALRFMAGFAGGYGLRYVIRETEAVVGMTFGFQHISCHPFKAKAADIDHRVIWDEWQGTYIVSRSWGIMTMYAGPQYSAVQLKYREQNVRRRLKGDDVWGICAGVIFPVGSQGSVTLGVRGGAETGADMNVGFSF